MSREKGKGRRRGRTFPFPITATASASSTRQASRRVRIGDVDHVEAHAGEIGLAGALPLTPYPPPPHGVGRGIAATFIGHSTFLVRTRRGDPDRPGVRNAMRGRSAASGRAACARLPCRSIAAAARHRLGQP